MTWEKILKHTLKNEKRHYYYHIIIIKLINIYAIFWAVQRNSLIVLFC